MKSEQRHGLNIWCGQDITVEGLQIDHSGGDGIMTGGLEDGTAAMRTRRVHIKDVVSSNNHRQGISVISAVGLLVEDCVFRDTNGTAPEAGEERTSFTTQSCFGSERSTLTVTQGWTSSPTIRARSWSTSCSGAAFSPTTTAAACR